MLNRPQEENNTNEIECKEVRREKLDKLYLDVEWLNDLKVLTLIQNKGAAGLGFLITLYTHIAKSKNALLPEKYIEALGKSIGLSSEESADSVTYLIEEELIEREGAELTHWRIKESQEALYQQRERYRDNKKKAQSFSIPSHENLKRRDRECDDPSTQHSTLNTQDQHSNLKINTQTFLDGEVPLKPKPSKIADSLEDHYEKFAESLLEPPGNNQAWEKSARWVNAGRRPMKKYPDLWFSMPDLAEAMRQWDQSKIPKSRYRDIFQMLKGRVDTLKIQGKSLEHISVFNWAIGWAKTETVEALNGEIKLEANKARL